MRVHLSLRHMQHPLRDSECPHRYYTSPHGWQAMMTWYNTTLATFPPVVRCATVPTRFGTTHILEAGPRTAPVLLLIHGSNVNALGWRHQLSELSAAFRIIAPDVPGFAGRSAAHRLNERRGEYADWLVDLLDALDIPSAVLVGSSSGGVFALTFAATYPRRCAGLALLNPAGISHFRIPYAWFRHPAGTQLLGTLSRRLLGYRWFARRLVAVGAAHQAPDPSSVEMAYLLLRYFRRQPPPGRLPDDVLRRVNTPLLLLLSDDEPYLYPAHIIKRIRNWLPHAEIRRLHRAGHDMHRDRPDLVNPALAAFASRCKQAESLSATQNPAPDVS